MARHLLHFVKNLVIAFLLLRLSAAICAPVSKFIQQSELSGGNQNILYFVVLAAMWTASFVLIGITTPAARSYHVVTAGIGGWLLANLPLSKAVQLDQLAIVLHVAYLVSLGTACLLLSGTEKKPKA